MRTAWGDSLLAAGVAAIAIGSTRLAGLGAVQCVLICCAAAPLAVRRRWPMPVLAVTALAVSGYLLTGRSYGLVLLAVMIAMYTVAVSASVRRSLPACALVAVVMWAHVWAELARGAVSVGYAAETLPWMGWLALPWAVGVIVQGRRGARTHARVESERERAYDERLRIAQEVHDTVGHGLAAIAMQAGVALHVLDNRPGEARAALEAIRQASRESLSDLRHTLDVVRSSGPRLGRVADLAARCGIPVDVRVTGMPVRLPATVDLAAYRIVQESLTNVLRHSGADRAEVAIAYGAGDVTVEVTDDGRSGASAVETGLGIAGMRARAVGVGGTLVAGPVPGRGFRVRARLPVEAPS